MMLIMMTMGSLMVGPWLGVVLLQNSMFVMGFGSSLSLCYGFQVITGLLGMDNISIILIWLTCWISGLNMLVDQSMSKNFLTVTLMSMLMLIMSFLVLNMLLFYMMFELVMFPMFLMILKYGSQYERITSSLYSLFYTLIGGSPLLIGIMSMKDMEMAFFYLESSCALLVMAPSYLTAFLIKSPMYTLHLWLPKAHVEAHVTGSMLLAGVLLKLGAYGLYRVMGILEVHLMLKTYFITISMWGALVSCSVCLTECDMKKIVAYSSIHHMGISITSSFSLNYMGMMGALSSCLGHGLFSAGSFFSVNSIYSRIYTRSMVLIKGLITLMPTLCLYWFIMIGGNSGVPPSINFAAELLSTFTIMSNCMHLTVIMGLVLFLSVAYSMHLYLNTSHGKSMLAVMNPMSSKELLICMMLILPGFGSITELSIF